MGKGMSEQPKVTGVLETAPAQFVAYENLMLAKTKAQNVLAREIYEIKTVKRCSVRVVRYQKNSRRFVGHKPFEPVIFDNG